MKMPRRIAALFILLLISMPVLMLFQNFIGQSMLNGYGDHILQKNVNGALATVRVNPIALAGSIYSFQYRGVEYVNYYDHGREIQSAGFYHSYGPCWNPNEAGGDYDGKGNTSSSSVVENISSDNGILKVTTNMAFWLKPGTNYRKPCLPDSPASSAQNTTILSGHRLEKTVKFGVGDIANVLDFHITFHVPYVPQNNYLNQFEVLTGYMPEQFNMFAVYDPIGRRRFPVPDVEREFVEEDRRYYPLIFSSSDQKSAMGVYATENPGTGTDFTYGAWGWDGVGTTKWNAVYRMYNEKAVPGVYPFRVFVAFGTPAEVEEAMAKLYKLYPDPRIKEIPAPHTHLVYQCTKPNSSALLSVWPSEVAVQPISCGIQPLFHLYKNQRAGLTPLYRCITAHSDHFASTDANCEGQYSEGILGLISSVPRENHVALNRFFISNYGHRVELEGGWPEAYTKEGVLGYVIPASIKYRGSFKASAIKTGTRISGWACLETVNKSLEVRIFAGHGDNRKLLATLPANLVPNDNISLACKTSKNSGHQFSYTIPPAIVTQYKGREITVIADWPSEDGGGFNSEIISNFGAQKL
jgi:hypothetical protein